MVNLKPMDKTNRATHMEACIEDERYHASKGSNFGPCVSIFAPGADILGPMHTDPVPQGFELKSGTSEATAHVSDAIASFLSAPRIGWTPSLMKLRLRCLSVSLRTIDAADTTNNLLQLPRLFTRTILKSAGCWGRLLQT
ncbi:hypothetical protein C8R43DRAFT_557816 [Mycena crocata]|nr:hypothetical protein C8R43DRAFT_557816 [Mycena crocata]